MKTIRLNESDIKRIVLKVLNEEEKKNKKNKEAQPKCMPENVIPLDEIVGKADMYGTYGNGISRRIDGVNSMVDTLGILNNIRLFKDVKDGGSHLAYELMNNLNRFRDIKDGGSHLAYDMMNHLNRFRNKNYYDETNGGCNKAMDKIIELYKENEHGTELVKDIERVLNLQTKEDQYTPSPRAKEYLKQSINLIKGL
jgi:hypothetical protein